MKYTIKRKGRSLRKTKYTKNKKYSKKTKYTRKINRKMRKGGYKFFENLNLDKYAKDPEIQFALQVYFKVPVNNSSQAKEILKANSNMFPSIKDLLKAIGVGTLVKGDRWDDYTEVDFQPTRDMADIDRSVSNQMKELERQSRRVEVIEDAEEKSYRPSRTIRAPAAKKSYNSANRQ